jgi:hypothetical protein
MGSASPCFQGSVLKFCPISLYQLSSPCESRYRSSYDIRMYIAGYQRC